MNRKGHVSFLQSVYICVLMINKKEKAGTIRPFRGARVYGIYGI